MVVLVLLGLIASVVTINVRGSIIKGKQNAARVQLGIFKEAINQFYIYHSRYPNNDEGLEALVTVTDDQPESLLDSRKVPKDPWGNDYQYNSPGRDELNFEIICLGADGRSGGDGANLDIASYELTQ